MERNNPVSSEIVGTEIHGEERSIGAVLIRAGRLTLNHVERILALQRAKGLRFGDAAIQLRLLNQADIEFALARQFDYFYLLPGESKVSDDLVAAYAPFSPHAEALRALRSQLMLRWFSINNHANKVLAVVSAERNEGRSYIAANLAVVFSQLGLRTLLIDADMRNPSQHNLFGIDNASGLSAALSGRVDSVMVKHVPGLPDLWLITAGALPPNPLELLTRAQFPKLLEELKQKFNVILLDSPAAADYADAQTVAVRAGATLIVARKNATRNWQVRGVSESVTQASAVVVGTVFNDF